MQAWQWVLIAIPAVVLLVSIVMVVRISARMRRSGASEGGSGGGAAYRRPAHQRPQRAAGPQRAAEDDAEVANSSPAQPATDRPAAPADEDASPSPFGPATTDQADDPDPVPQRVAGDDADVDLDQSPTAEHHRAERAITDDEPESGLEHLDDQPAEDDSPAEALFRRPESR